MEASKSPFPTPRTRGGIDGGGGRIMRLQISLGAFKRAAAAAATHIVNGISAAAAPLFSNSRMQLFSRDRHKLSLSIILFGSIGTVQMTLVQPSDH